MTSARADAPQKKATHVSASHCLAPPTLTAVRAVRPFLPVAPAPPTPLSLAAVPPSPAHVPGAAHPPSPPSDKIIEPVQSRCAILRYSRLTDAQLLKRLMEVCQKEKVAYNDEGLEAIIFTAEGDMRQVRRNETRKRGVARGSLVRV